MSAILMFELNLGEPGTPGLQAWHGVISRILTSLPIRNNRLVFLDFQNASQSYRNISHVTNMSQTISAVLNNAAGPVDTEPLQRATLDCIHLCCVLQQALQNYGQPDWSLKLLSMDSVDPTQALAIELVCNKIFGGICLDHSGLSQGAVKGIIAAGCIFLVLLSALLCVFLDICKRSGRVSSIPSHNCSVSASLSSDTILRLDASCCSFGFQISWR